jgi:hypothetical protein
VTVRTTGKLRRPGAQVFLDTIVRDKTMDGV